MLEKIMLVICMIMVLLMFFGMIIDKMPDILNQLLKIKECYKNFKDEWSKK